MQSSQIIGASAGGRVATPTAFPGPGTYGVTQRVTLLCATPGVTIHYSTDGSDPVPGSPIFDQYRLPVLEAINDGDRGVTSTYTIKALAVKDGMRASPVAIFTYSIERRSKDVYLAHEIRPGVHVILDYDDTKMFLLLGSQRALLIDAGLGTGNLRAFMEGLAGGLPLDVVITHGHPDHIALMGQFQDSYKVYMSHLDLPLARTFVEMMGYKIDLEQVIDLHEGFVFDLGDRRLSIYEVPGHSAGSIVLFDETDGILYSGDAVGSNRPTITDSLWMQFPGMATIDIYLSSLQVFRSKLGGRIKEIYGGHNDFPIYGEQYLDNLQQAAQTLVDNGPACLLPSLRPTDAWQVVVGDRLTDPNWAAINVSKEACLSLPPERIATLSNLLVGGCALEPGFTPSCFEYRVVVRADMTAIAITPTTTSSRCRGLAVNGTPSGSGQVHTANLAMGITSFDITVTSPDGSQVNTYTLIVSTQTGASQQ